MKETQRATYSINETAKLLGISRAAAYLAVKRQDIKTIQIGQRILVPKTWLDRKLGIEGGEAA